MSKQFDFKNHPLIIAEIGQAHEGSLGIAHSCIDALAHSIKFLTRIADDESTLGEPFRIRYPDQDKL